MDIETSCLVFGIGSGYVHCGIHSYIVYNMLSRMIVLYSRYRANQGTNMSAVLIDVTLFLFLLPLRLGSVLEFPNILGCVPHHAVYSITFGFGAGDSASFQPSPTTSLCLSPCLVASCV